MKYTCIILLSFFSTVASAAIVNNNHIKIGFSQCYMQDEWRISMVEDMEREISFHVDYNIDLIVKNANYDSEKQINDIKELEKLGVDVMIISPNESDKLTPIVEEIYKKGIPVILIDRTISSTNYTSFISGNNIEAGKEVGYYTRSILNGSGKIVEITGSSLSSPSIERSKGFHSIIDQDTGVKIVKVLDGKWLENVTQELTDSLFRSFTDFDLIFAHNDFMAKAASNSCSKYNIKPFIVGIDGMNKVNSGVDMVRNGVIDATVYYANGGDIAIQTAIDLYEGKDVKKNIMLNTYLIDKNIARTIWAQREATEKQIERIDAYNSIIGDLENILSRRGTFMTLLFVIIAILTILVIIIFIILRSKNRINKILAEKNRTINKQNRTIEKQRNETMNLMIVAEEEKENKLKLFTDLSHEFRTIVTLIINPINDILSTQQDPNVTKQLLIVQKNGERLFRLTDAILQFRNLDENKLHLSFMNCNISSFVQNIIKVFYEYAKEKEITIKTDIEKNVYAEIDLSVIESVIYNLLSNSIKYNKKRGSVFFSLKLIKQHVLIEVRDTGIGISEEDLPNIFNRFYKGNIDKKSSSETQVGIGLALCKELIQLHGGTIKADSVINVGSSFKISIPQSNSKPIISVESTQTNINNETIIDKFEKTVLVVEDNPDLLIVISNIINKYYKVITASNGSEGLKMVIKNSPDIIISDILMPVMDGMQMCAELKNNVTTRHIPIILLTAIDSHSNIVKSFDLGADDYIVKPFDETILLSKIKHLINNRQMLLDYLSPSPFIRKIIKSPEDTFIKRCINDIYENLENEDYSLSNLSKNMNMSQSTLFRKIKEKTNLKPVDFIKKTKLNYAAILLLEKNDYNISDVAWHSGFNDPKYFRKCFIDEFGISPSEYVKKAFRTNTSLKSTNN